jgi:hypothetical protein
MYWLRDNSLIDLIFYALLTIGWAVGGWLLVTHAFHWRRVERYVVGLAAGFILFIEGSSLLANILPLTLAYSLTSGLVLLAGILSACFAKQRLWFRRRDIHALPLLIGLAAIIVLFTLILRGQAIFDEYLHLPLISIMAAGDIPPHFYLNPDFSFAYHYGIQVFAASMVRLGDFFPWSAWDVSRSLAIAFTLLLGWIWVRRVTRSKLAAWLGSLVITFGGGTRWLLLLLPASWLDWISQNVNLVGTGLSTAPTLAEALHKSWVIEGGGPVAFPFAFHNGIFVPVFFILGSTGALPFMTVVLLLLLLPRGRFSKAGLILWCLIFTSLALSAEHLYTVIWIGILLAIAMSLVLHKRMSIFFHRDRFAQWGVILLVSASLAIVQGGFITETARNLIASITNTASQSYHAYGFSIRWPPGLLSAHLGELSITNPGQLVALLFELGPVLLLLPLIFVRFKKELKQNNWFWTSLTASVGISLVFPLFFRYEVDRSITRLAASGLWTCLVLAFPILWMAFRHANLFSRLGLVIGYVLCIVAGIVIFRVQLYSISTPQYSYFIDGLDAGYTVDYWNQLPAGAQVLDRIPERSVTIFGRITRANSGIYEHLPEWEALIANPDPILIASAGYDYVYMDKIWWDNLTPKQKSNFMIPCIDIIDARQQNNNSNYRLLVDVSSCR